MTPKTGMRDTAGRFAKTAILVAIAVAFLPTTPGCVAYQIYSGIKTVEKVKDFTEDHILKHDDDDSDKDKNKHSSSSSQNH